MASTPNSEHIEDFIDFTEGGKKKGIPAVLLLKKMQEFEKHEKGNIICFVGKRYERTYKITPIR